MRHQCHYGFKARSRIRIWRDDHRVARRLTKEAGENRPAYLKVPGNHSGPDGLYLLKSIMVLSPGWAK